MAWGELLVHIGRFHAGARDDQRRARFIDEDGVNLVDNGEIMTALHALDQHA